MTWTTHHNRGEILRQVMETADARCDGRLPTDLAGVAEKFDDEVDLLSALQLRWHTHLAGCIEQALTDHPADLEAAVAAAWRTAATETPGVRAVLDHYREHPADDRMAHMLARDLAKEHILLAVMSGQRGCSDEVAAAIGASIENRARCGTCSETLLEQRVSLLDRIRAALAA